MIFNKTGSHTCKASCSALVDISTAARQATNLLLRAKSEFSRYKIPGILLHPPAEFHNFKLIQNNHSNGCAPNTTNMHGIQKRIICRPCLAALVTKE